jgi:hypothetical protein
MASPTTGCDDLPKLITLVSPGIALRIAVSHLESNPDFSIWPARLTFKGHEILPISKPSKCFSDLKELSKPMNAAAFRPVPSYPERDAAQS